MNKKDLNELRKNFSQASDLFTLNHVVSAFVDAEKNIKCVKSDAFHNIPSEESDCYMETLRRILAGTLGKGLLEYEFPNEAYEETGAQNILYNALSCRLADESAVNLMLDQIVKNMDYISTYAILIGHCTYTVFNIPSPLPCCIGTGETSHNRWTPILPQTKAPKPEVPITPKCGGTSGNSKKYR